MHQNFCRSELLRWSRRICTGLLAATAVIGIASVARAADNADVLAKAAVCSSCHGPAGISPVPTYPNLAGQHPLYLEYALRRYRAKERSGDNANLMVEVAKSLSERDINQLATYYGSLPPAQ
jgi:cytochrome c553